MSWELGHNLQVHLLVQVNTTLFRLLYQQWDEYKSWKIWVQWPKCIHSRSKSTFQVDKQDIHRVSEGIENTLLASNIKTADGGINLRKHEVYLRETNANNYTIHSAVQQGHGAFREFLIFPPNYFQHVGFSALGLANQWSQNICHSFKHHVLS